MKTGQCTKLKKPTFGRQKSTYKTSRRIWRSVSWLVEAWTKASSECGQRRGTSYTVQTKPAIIPKHLWWYGQRPVVFYYALIYGSFCEVKESEKWKQIAKQVKQAKTSTQSHLTSKQFFEHLQSQFSEAFAHWVTLHSHSTKAHLHWLVCSAQMMLIVGPINLPLLFFPSKPNSGVDVWSVWGLFNGIPMC